MRKNEKTARKDGQRAAAAVVAESRDAADYAAILTNKRWRTIHRRKDGTTVLRSPSGIEYHGTVAEIREADLMPLNRRRLMEGLMLLRHITKPRTEERRDLVANRRREAIEFDAFDVRCDRYPLGISNALAIEAIAAARAMGQSLDEFVAEWVETGIEAAKDQEPELPFTRYERAALARLDRREKAKAKAPAERREAVAA